MALPMPSPDNEVRPYPRAEAESKSFRGDDVSLADLDALDAIHHAFVCGYDTGLAHGQRMAAEHLAAEILHRQAAEVIQFVSDLPERDPEADRAAAARRQARWSA